jgi:hypothetical protein
MRLAHAVIRNAVGVFRRGTPVIDENKRFVGVMITSIVVIWLASHPYVGVVHDARLYAIQAVQFGEPALYYDDLYFLHGSQDSFTLFSPVYSPLIEVFGISAAHTLLTIAGSIAWICAAWKFCQCMWGDTQRTFLAIVGIVSLNATYGTQNIFSYAENFGTPRLIAEALLLFSLAYLLSGRNVSSVFCMVAAFALHPLMSAPIMLVGFLMIEKRWSHLLLVLLAGCTCFALAVHFDVAPFNRAGIHLDDEWYSAIKQRVAFAFIAKWKLVDFFGLVLPVVAIFYSSFDVGEVQRRLFMSSLIVSVLGIVTTFVFVDQMRNVLALNLQPWRALWFLTLLGNACVLTAWDAQRKRTLERNALMIAALFSLIEGWVGFPAVCSAIAALCSVVARKVENPESARYGKHYVLSGIRIVLAIDIALIAGAFFVALQQGSSMGLQRSLILPLLALGVGFVVAVFRQQHLFRLAGVCLGVSLIVSLAHIDKRSEWTKFVESGRSRDEIRAFLAGDRQVYWERGVELMWFAGQLPSYYSCLQGTGVMFSKSLALDYKRRTETLRGLATSDFAENPSGLCAERPASDIGGITSKVALLQACRRLPDLDAVVLLHRVEGLDARVWQSPVPVHTVENGRRVDHSAFYRYGCRKLRAGVTGLQGGDT